MQFTGCGTALVTPFQPDFSLDEAALRKLVQRQIRGGVDFLVPCGTTGEKSHSSTRQRTSSRRRDHAGRVSCKSASASPVRAGTTHRK